MATKNYKKNTDLIIPIKPSNNNAPIIEDAADARYLDSAGPGFLTPNPFEFDNLRPEAENLPDGGTAFIQPETNIDEIGSINLLNFNSQPIGFITKDLGQPLFSLDNHYMFEVFTSGRDANGFLIYQIVKQSLEGSETIRYSPNYLQTKKNTRYRISFKFKHIVREVTNNTKLEFIKSNFENFNLSLGNEATKTFFTITPEDFGPFNEFKRFNIEFDSESSNQFLFEMKATDTMFTMEGLQVEDLGGTPFVDEDLIDVDDTGNDDDITVEDGDTIEVQSEQFSPTFTIPEIEIEQTLYQPYDPFSGLDIISMSFFNNTKQDLINLNKDGRIPLGLFYFDDDNIITDNFPPIIGNNKFRQIEKLNLVPNGSGKYIKSKYESNHVYSGDVFIPDGGWGYCTYDGVGLRYRSDDMYDSTLGGTFPEDNQALNGTQFIASFEQSENFTENLDNQNATGYAGYYPYHGLLNLQRVLTKANENSNQFEIANDFFAFVQASTGSAGTRFTPREARSYKTGNPRVYFPNFAKWVDGVPQASFGRCLEFLGISYKNGSFDTDGDDVDEITGDEFNWSESSKLMQIPFNQYRSLNQVVKIYSSTYGKTAGLSEFDLSTVLEVRFRMYTESGYGLLHDNRIEIGIIDGDGSVGNPMRVNDLEGTGNNPYGYPKSHHYWPHGEFNTTTYDDNLNTINTIDASFSWFGSRGVFENTSFNTWQTFSYKFLLGDVFNYSNGIMRDLYLMVQTDGNFYGKVLLDDFQVYESNDFIPDVDVRKKISVGNYGKADLTKYYDKKLQPEEYKDTIGPLEAQFYFYPNYPSNEVFNVKRTPVYQSFKRGLFYIYDIDWGDGSPNEFLEPKKIDEETALYHTYKTSGIFEIIGFMIRMKTDNRGNELGITNSKKFRLRININEGLDEDFTYFGSDGFSFIPYKNTSPIIGGYSKESNYYKSLVRQLGFYSLEKETVISGSTVVISGNQQLIPTALFNLYEDGIGDGGNSLWVLEQDDYRWGPDIFDTDGDGIADSSFPVKIYADLPTVEKVINLYGPGTLANYKDSGFNTLYTIRWNAEAESWAYRGPDDWINNGDDSVNNYFLTRIVVNQSSSIEVPLKTFIDFKNDSDKLKAELALTKMDSEYKLLTDILPYYTKKRFSIKNESNYDLLKPVSNFYNPTSTLADNQNTNTSPEYLATLPFPQYIEEFDFNENGEIDFNDANEWAIQPIMRLDISELLYNLLAELDNPTGNYYTYPDYVYDWVNVSSVPTYPDIINNGIEVIEDELGKSIGDINLTSIKYYKEPKSIWETLGFEEEDLEQIGNPNDDRYWKNIIPKDYSIYNREGVKIGEKQPIDIYSEQDWLDDYYYPVLPKYGADGKFLETIDGDGNYISNTYPNNKIPFPLEAPISNEKEKTNTLSLNIVVELVDNNIYSDNSGNENYGFSISDYKPKFNNKTLKPEKIKNTTISIYSTTEGAF